MACFAGLATTFLVYGAYTAAHETERHFVYLHTIPSEPRAEWVRVLNAIQKSDAMCRVYVGAALCTSLITTLTAGAEFSRQCKRVAAPEWARRLGRPPEDVKPH